MLKKYFLIAVGFLSFGLGALGAILPLLPTVPFLLLSAFCFARSSKAFHAWLKKTRLYQQYVAEYLETRSISLHNKIKILLNIYILMGISIYFSPMMAVKMMLGLMVTVHTICLLFFIETRKPDKETEKQRLKNTEE